MSKLAALSLNTGLAAHGRARQFVELPERTVPLVEQRRRTRSFGAARGVRTRDALGLREESLGQGASFHEALELRFVGRELAGFSNNRR